ncbi:MAG: septal ring lytic transglycosylase RlpA family protein [Pseudomonadota bacterium]
MGAPRNIQTLCGVSVRAVAGAALLLAAACATSTGPAPKPHHKLGEPYKVDGRWYRPAADPAYDAVGTASWYGAKFQGRPTANGEIFDKRLMSAAHKTLPMPSIVEVTNLDNGRRVRVRLNDRGPFVGDRIIDVSEAAARALGFRDRGLARVRVRYLGAASLADAAPKPGRAPRVAEASPARPVYAPAAVGSSDPIAGLIAASEAQAAAPHGAFGARTGAAVDRAPFVRVGAFADAGGARAAKRSLARNARARVEPSTTGGRTLHTLLLGPYHDLRAANAQLAAVLDAGYPDAAIVLR